MAAQKPHRLLVWGGVASLLIGANIAVRSESMAAHGPRRGFSLVEVLIVIAIIGLLVGLVFPVLAMSRRQGDIAQTTAHMRQLAVATALYQQTHEGYPPMGLDTLIDTRLISDKRLLFAKGDPTDGMGSTAFNCTSLPRKVRHATSFDDIFVYPHQQARAAALSPRHGWFAFRGYGDRVPTLTLNVCSVTRYGFEGLLLRALNDTSVERTRLALLPPPGPSFGRGLRIMDLWLDPEDQ